MNAPVQPPTARRLLLLVGFFAALVAPDLSGNRGSIRLKRALAQPERGSWSEPTLVSTNEEITNAWFPDIAVDVEGRVHVVWDSTGPPRHLGDRGLGMTMHAFRRTTDETWSQPNDIAAGSGYEVSRPAIAADRTGTLHMLFRPSGIVQYTHADGAKAHSARAWSQPRTLGGSQNYMTDIAVDSKGMIHTVWYEWIPVEFSEEELFRYERSAYLSDVFYRRSADGGTTWSEPLNLSRTPNAGSGRPQIEIDSEDRIHVAWEEGWDRNAQNDIAGELPVCGMYVYSGDGGRTWSHAKVVNAPFTRRSVLTGTFSHYEAGLRQLVHKMGADHPRYSEVLVYQSRIVQNVIETRRNQANLEEEESGSIAALRIERGLQELELERTAITDQLNALASSAISMSLDELSSLRASRSTRGAMEALPHADNAQVTIGVDDDQGVLLVWRSRALRRLYYTWSEDGGMTWGPVKEIPEVYARPWNEPYDIYATATDSLGHVHLLAVATTAVPEPNERDIPLGVYHLIWDGEAWSEPEVVAHYAGLAIPEYPRISVSHGNRLHAVWYLRSQGDWGESTQIWYSEEEIDTPPEEPASTPRPTATPTTTPIPSSPPTPTPFPTVVPGGSGMARGLRSESDDVARLLLSLLPVLVVMMTFIIIKRLRRG